MTSLLLELKHIREYWDWDNSTSSIITIKNIFPFLCSESAKGDVKKEESKEEAMEVDEHKPADTKSPTKEAATVST